MLALISDARFDSLTTLAGMMIAILPGIAAAYWARSAQKNSVEAKENSQEAKENSQEAKENSAGALHEVKANGGMSDPDPTLKDYIVFVGESVEREGRRLDSVEALLADHIRHSQMMDSILAEVFFVVKPELKDKDFPG